MCQGQEDYSSVFFSRLLPIFGLLCDVFCDAQAYMVFEIQSQDHPVVIRGLQRPVSCNKQCRFLYSHSIHIEYCCLLPLPVDACLSKRKMTALSRLHQDEYRILHVLMKSNDAIITGDGTTNQNHSHATNSQKQQHQNQKKWPNPL